MWLLFTPYDWLVASGVAVMGLSFWLMFRPIHTNRDAGMRPGKPI
jgi:hypothetical protein